MINPFYHILPNLRDIFSGDYSYLTDSEVSELPESIRNNIPDFKRFLIAYFDWLQKNKPINRVDIDKIPDEFVSQLKYELALNFPDQNKILDSLEQIPDNATDIDKFYGNNVISFFTLSYDVTSQVVNSYDVSMIHVNGDIIKLVDSYDYIIKGKVIYLIESGDIFKNKPLDTDVNLVVTYHLKPGTKLVSTSNKSPMNYKNFLKRIKDFYNSKGSESSFNFIFNLLYNESIRVTYPKDKIFKSSGCEYTVAKKVYCTRLMAYPDGVIIKAVKFIETGFLAPVNSAYSIGIINDRSIQEIDVDNIDLSNAPNINDRIILIDDTGNEYMEYIVPCVTGVEIIDGGSYYSPGDVFEIRYGNASATIEVKNVKAGSIKALTIKNGGINYKQGEICTFSNSTDQFGTPASFIIESVDSIGSVQSVRLLNGGSGYRFKPTFKPEKYVYKSYFNLFDLNLAKENLVTISYIRSVFNAGKINPLIFSGANSIISDKYNYYITGADYQTLSQTDQNFYDEFYNLTSFDNILKAIAHRFNIFYKNAGSTYTYTKLYDNALISSLNHNSFYMNYIYDFVLTKTNNDRFSAYVQDLMLTNLANQYALKVGKNYKDFYSESDFSRMSLGLYTILEDSIYHYIFDNNLSIDTITVDEILHEMITNAGIVKLFYIIKQFVQTNIYNFDIIDGNTGLIRTDLTTYFIDLITLNLFSNINKLQDLYEGRISLFTSGLDQLLLNGLPSDLTVYQQIRSIVSTDNSLLSGIDSDDVGYIDPTTSELSIGYGLELDIVSDIGQIKSFVVSNSGGYIENDPKFIDIIDLNGSTAQIIPKIGTLYSAPPVMKYKSGIPSSNTAILPDNHYYQEYSYVIESTRIITEWAPYIKKLCHPAGMKYFGLINLPTVLLKAGIRDWFIDYVLDITLDRTNYGISKNDLTPIISKLIYNIYIFTNDTYQNGSLYRSFDRFKFEIDNENANKYVNKYFWDREDLVPANRIEFIKADTTPESFDFLDMSVDEVEKKYYRYFFPRPDSFINVYPKTYFVRPQQKYIPGTQPMGPNYRSLERNKTFSKLDEFSTFDQARSLADTTIYDSTDTISLDSIERNSKLKVNFALPSKITLINNTNNTTLEV